ncbi:MAG: PAS domain S-box protein [Bacteroidetes bacterium]|nr:PAS domain S-box protein [Bacteroidota bacterium]
MNIFRKIMPDPGSPSGGTGPFFKGTNADLFFEIIPDLICIASSDGCFKKLNPAWESLLGFTRDELLSRPIFEFIHPDDLAETNEEIAKQITGKETKSFVNRYRCKDNSYKWLEWNAIASPNGTDLYAVARDITDRIQAEQLIRESEERYEAAFKTSPDAITITRMDGTYVDVNDGFTKHTGYTKEDVIAIPSQELGIWVNLEDRDKLIDGLKKDGAINNLELQIRCKDGSIITGLMSASVIKLRNENCIMSITRDTTQSRKVEIALQESQKKYEAAFQTSPDAISITKMNGVYVDLNLGFTNLTGFTKADAVGRSSVDLGIWSVPEDRLKLVEGIKNQGSVNNLESVFRTKDGELRTGLMSASLIQINDEPHILSVTREITERAQAEEKIRQSEEIFRSLAEHSTNMIVIILKNRIYYANELFVKKLGYTKEELFASDFDFVKLAVPEHQELIGETILMQASREEPEQFEFIMNAKDGRKLYTMVNTKLIGFGDDKAILGVIVDISEQRWAEEILKRKANQFEHFSALMVDRELKLAELKLEVNNLLERLGEPLKFDVPMSEVGGQKSKVR